MKSSWKIAQVAGIGIRLHVTFPLLLIWMAVVHFQEASGWGAFIADVGFIAALFAIVVLHELGHAMAARRFGIRTHDITLLPIGGVAHLERMPDNPRQELIVALAGPAVNVGLAVILAAAVLVVSGQPAWSVSNLLEGGLLVRLLGANVGMAVFNLVPAFPMDGGRVLRAFLALRLDYARATAIAARIGQVIAVAAGVLGLLINPLLVLLAVFVWMGAGQEAGMIRLKASLADVPVGRISVGQFATLAPGMSIEEAVDRALGTFQPAFPVMAEGVLIGMIDRGALLVSLSGRARPVSVGAIMRQDFSTVDSEEKVGQVLVRLLAGEMPVLPVLQAGRMVGLLSLSTIIEYLHWHEAQARAAKSHVAGRTLGEPPVLHAH